MPPIARATACGLLLAASLGIAPARSWCSPTAPDHPSADGATLEPYDALGLSGGGAQLIQRRGVSEQLPAEPFAHVKLGADLNRVRYQVIQQLATHAHGEKGTTAAEREGLLIEGLEPLDDELDPLDEIHALLRDVVERLERIERRLIEGDDTP